MNVLIIEDELAATRRLSKLLNELEPECRIIAELDSIETSVAWLLQNNHPDLFFMDIHLADGSSFEIFKQVKITKPIIFTTAYDQYAINAFKVSAIDYLLKPIKKVDLEMALAKFSKMQASTSNIDYRVITDAILQQLGHSKRFLVKVGNQMKIIEAKDAAYFYTQNKITYLVDQKGKKYPLDHPLDKLEEIIDPMSFFRVNRQFIVSVQAIKEMVSYSKSRVKIDLEPTCDLEVIVSTERSPLFKKWLTGYTEL